MLRAHACVLRARKPFPKGRFCECHDGKNAVRLEKYLTDESTLKLSTVWLKKYDRIRILIQKKISSRCFASLLSGEEVIPLSSLIAILKQQKIKHLFNQHSNSVKQCSPHDIFSLDTMTFLRN
ncbi:uncharacterized protein LOC112590041 [Harpegnathos saltator]|uniref:uncharacterized protein LOC112590041 n=1 Tax=Harpegnathos saltator TaxID=610380 RepID=UPI000DBEE1D5|nr:uncharacterized protein LOC112590041 [Harpegnathos saltator]